MRNNGTSKASDSGVYSIQSSDSGVYSNESSEQQRCGRYLQSLSVKIEFSQTVVTVKFFFKKNFDGDSDGDSDKR
jgi:hypothetical protein